MTTLNPAIIEKAAKAIHQSYDDGWTWEKDCTENRRHCKNTAKTILTAALPIPTQAELAELDESIGQLEDEYKGMDESLPQYTVLNAAKLYRSLFTPNSEDLP